MPKSFTCATQRVFHVHFVQIRCSADFSVTGKQGSRGVGIAAAASTLHETTQTTRTHQGWILDRKVAASLRRTTLSLEPWMQEVDFGREESYDTDGSQKARESVQRDFATMLCSAASHELLHPNAPQSTICHDAQLLS